MLSTEEEAFVLLQSNNINEFCRLEKIRLTLRLSTNCTRDTPYSPKMKEELGNKRLEKAMTYLLFWLWPLQTLGEGNTVHEH